MKYNHAMAEREYKREWKVAKLEMRKAGMQRKQIREAARAYRLEFNGERRFYRRTDVVPACEREDRPPKGVDTLFQESHSMHSPDLEDDIGECALPGFVDSKNEEKTERNAGYLVVSHSGGGMLRQGTRKGIRRTPANRGMRAHWVVKGLDISEDVCHGMCP